MTPAEILDRSALASDPAAALACLTELFAVADQDRGAAHLVGALLGRVMMRDILARAEADPAFALQCGRDVVELAAQLVQAHRPPEPPAPPARAAKAA